MHPVTSTDTCECMRSGVAGKDDTHLGTWCKGTYLGFPCHEVIQNALPQPLEVTIGMVS